MITFMDLAQAPAVPWKNGGGSTQELACWPPGAGMDTFEWRVSVATIASSGPFSTFPGVERQIMLLGGDGVQLQAAQTGWAHALDQRWQPFAFSGDDAVDCHMRGGHSTDFNLMLRRSAWRGTLQVVRNAPPPVVGAAGLCLVLQGTWRCNAGGDGPRVLKAGQGVWWAEEPGGGSDAPWCVEPLHAGSGATAADTVIAADTAPVLAWVALEPAEKENLSQIGPKSRYYHA